MAGAFGEALLPRRAELYVEKTQTAGRDFILMRNAGGAEHDGHGSKLFELAAVAFAVKAAEEQAEEGEIVGVHGEFAGNGMAEIAEHGAGMFDAVADGAEELTTLEAAFADRDGLTFRHAALSDGEKTNPISRRLKPQT